MFEEVWDVNTEALATGRWPVFMRTPKEDDFHE